MITILREMPPWRRLELLEDACTTAMELARSGLRNRHPEADSTSIQRFLMDLVLGSELAEEAFGPFDP